MPKAFRRQWALACSLLLLCTLVALPSVQATTFPPSGTIAAGQVIDDDVFLIGENLIMDGIVRGDLVAIGGRVQINGQVEGSLFVIGQEVTANGLLQGSLYGGGLALTLGPRARIGRNAYLGGYALQTAAGSFVGRDLFLAGYQALVSGQVERDMQAILSTCDIDGAIGRHVIARLLTIQPVVPRLLARLSGVQPAAPGLRVTGRATILGNLTYTAPQEATLLSAPLGGVIWHLPQANVTRGIAQPLAARIGIEALRWLLGRLQALVTWLLPGALLMWLAPGMLSRLASRIRSGPLLAVGRGLLVLGGSSVVLLAVALAVGALAILLSLLTLRGLALATLAAGLSSVGLAAVLLALGIAFGTKLVAAYLVGEMILGRSRAAGHPYMPLLVGLALYVLLRAIPGAGPFLGLLATLLGLGAIWPLFAPSLRFVS